MIVRIIRRCLARIMGRPVAWIDPVGGVVRERMLIPHPDGKRWRTRLGGSCIYFNESGVTLSNIKLEEWGWVIPPKQPKPKAKTLDELMVESEELEKKIQRIKTGGQNG